MRTCEGGTFSIHHRVIRCGNGGFAGELVRRVRSSKKVLFNSLGSTHCLISSFCHFRMPASHSPHSPHSLHLPQMSPEHLDLHTSSAGPSTPRATIKALRPLTSKLHIHFHFRSSASTSTSAPSHHYTKLVPMSSNPVERSQSRGREPLYVSHTHHHHRRVQHSPLYHIS